MEYTICRIIRVISNSLQEGFDEMIGENCLTYILSSNIHKLLIVSIALANSTAISSVSTTTHPLAIPLSEIVIFVVVLKDSLIHEGFL